MNKIYSMQSYNIQITAGTGGQIQVFINGNDKGYFRGAKTFAVNNGDSISVWCDADSGYTFTNLCIDGTTTCTTARPFNFTANMNLQMTATFTSTQQQCNMPNKNFTINGSSASITVSPGDSLTAVVRCDTNSCDAYCAGGASFRIIASSSPLGTGDIRVDSGNNYFSYDSSTGRSCGTSTFSLYTQGTYTLRTRWCCVWTSTEHCATYDTDMANTVTVVVKSGTGGGASKCDPSVCDGTKNKCILGQCVPNTVLLGGAAAFVLYMITRD